ncbi:hypothetical protein FE773_02965 [Caminibacter mediatlanticus TB-2]|uniref:Uncharacterized protein n=1 Tax=Caminibacter mediatlanticus TB-2 TaxID=391592 RepID=A0AAI9AGL8_9BACT|nr:hypothetical protein [Caminibacter mediatlanticus]EDM23245.1 hypothetical protein CMTB2_06091 [Caminibacter mediatlanticus TB-2]QCT94171.1 hypothetical protein FE773_02965 [Caminibacter mediatlanticus TB-2]
MKKLTFIFLTTALFYTGCSFTKTSTNVKNFTKCYINKIPAPFWVCYQSPFLSVGKVTANKVTRLKQEEAYSLGVSDLVNKLQAKTKLFLRRIGINDEKQIRNILSQVKNFVVINALQGDSWYSKKEKMLYVKVSVNKEEFKKFLLSKFKNKDKKLLEDSFNEIF